MGQGPSNITCASDAPWASEALRKANKWLEDRERAPLIGIKTAELDDASLEYLPEICWVKGDDLNEEELSPTLRMVNATYSSNKPTDYGGRNWCLRANQMMGKIYTHSERLKFEIELKTAAMESMPDPKDSFWEDMTSSIQFVKKSGFLYLKCTGNSNFLKHILATLKIYNQAIYSTPTPLAGITAPWGISLSYAGYSILALTLPPFETSSVEEIEDSGGSTLRYDQIAAAQAFSYVLQELMNINISTPLIQVISDKDTNKWSNGCIHVLPGCILCKQLREVRMELRHGQSEVTSVRNHVLLCAAYIKSKPESYLTQEILVNTIHSFGLSLRHMGGIYSACLSNASKEAILVEILSRASKRIWSREVTSLAQTNEYTGELAHLLGVTSQVFSCSTPAFSWVGSLAPMIHDMYFIDVSTFKINSSLSKRVWVRLCTLCGVIVRNGKPSELIPVIRSCCVPSSLLQTKGRVVELQLIKELRKSHSAPLLAISPVYVTLIEIHSDTDATEQLMISLREAEEFYPSSLYNNYCIGLAFFSVGNFLSDFSIMIHGWTIQNYPIAAAINLLLFINTKIRSGTTNALEHIITIHSLIKIRSKVFDGTVPPLLVENIGFALAESGELLLENKHFEDGEEVLDTALEICKDQPSDSRSILTIKNNIATALYHVGKHDEAVVLYRSILNLSNNKISSMNNLATVLYHTKNPKSWKEAESLYRKALSVFNQPKTPSEEQDCENMKHNLIILRKTRRKWGALTIQCAVRRLLAKKKASDLKLFSTLPQLLHIKKTNSKTQSEEVIPTYLLGFYKKVHPSEWLYRHRTWYKSSNTSQGRCACILEVTLSKRLTKSTSLWAIASWADKSSFSGVSTKLIHCTSQYNQQQQTFINRSNQNWLAASDKTPIPISVEVYSIGCHIQSESERRSELCIQFESHLGTLNCHHEIGLLQFLEMQERCSIKMKGDAFIREALLSAQISIFELIEYESRILLYNSESWSGITSSCVSVPKRSLSESRLFCCSHHYSSLCCLLSMSVGCGNQLFVISPTEILKTVDIEEATRVIINQHQDSCYRFIENKFSVVESDERFCNNRMRQILDNQTTERDIINNDERKLSIKILAAETTNLIIEKVASTKQLLVGKSEILNNESRRRVLIIKQHCDQLVNMLSQLFSSGVLLRATSTLPTVDFIIYLESTERSSYGSKYHQILKQLHEDCHKQIQTSVIISQQERLLRNNIVKERSVGWDEVCLRISLLRDEDSKYQLLSCHQCETANRKNNILMEINSFLLLTDGGSIHNDISSLVADEERFRIQFNSDQFQEFNVISKTKNTTAREAITNLYNNAIREEYELYAMQMTSESEKIKRQEITETEAALFPRKEDEFDSVAASMKSLAVDVIVESERKRRVLINEDSTIEQLELHLSSISDAYHVVRCFILSEENIEMTVLNNTNSTELITISHEDLFCSSSVEELHNREVIQRNIIQRQSFNCIPYHSGSVSFIYSQYCSVRILTVKDYFSTVSQLYYDLLNNVEIHCWKFLTLEHETHITSNVKWCLRNEIALMITTEQKDRELISKQGLLYIREIINTIEPIVSVDQTVQLASSIPTLQKTNEVVLFFEDEEDYRICLYDVAYIPSVKSLMNVSELISRMNISTTRNIDMLQFSEVLQRSIIVLSEKLLANDQVENLQRNIVLADEEYNIQSNREAHHSQAIHRNCSGESKRLLALEQASRSLIFSDQLSNYDIIIDEESDDRKVFRNRTQQHEERIRQVLMREQQNEFDHRKSLFNDDVKHYAEKILRETITKNNKAILFTSKALAFRLRVVEDETNELEDIMNSCSYMLSKLQRAEPPERLKVSDSNKKIVVTVAVLRLCRNEHQIRNDIIKQFTKHIETTLLIFTSSLSAMEARASHVATRRIASPPLNPTVWLSDSQTRRRDGIQTAESLAHRRILQHADKSKIMGEVDPKTWLECVSWDTLDLKFRSTFRDVFITPTGQTVIYLLGEACDEDGNEIIVIVTADSILLFESDAVLLRAELISDLQHCTCGIDGWVSATGLVSTSMRFHKEDLGTKFIRLLFNLYRHITKNTLTLTYTEDEMGASPPHKSRSLLRHTSQSVETNNTKRVFPTSAVTADSDMLQNSLVDNQTTTTTTTTTPERSGSPYSHLITSSPGKVQGRYYGLKNKSVDEDGSPSSPGREVTARIIESQNSVKIRKLEDTVENMLTMINNLKGEMEILKENGNHMKALSEGLIADKRDHEIKKILICDELAINVNAIHTRLLSCVPSTLFIKTANTVETIRYQHHIIAIMEYVDMLRSSSFVNETDVLIQDSWGRLAAMNDDWTNEYMFVHTWTGVIYYALNIPLLIFNFFPAINPLERWKIQKGKYETFPNVCKMMVYVVVNQTLSTAAAVMTQPRRDISIETVPSCVDLAWQVVACMVLYDSFFFCLHCIMHTEWMYYNIHQTHHLSKTSIGISNAYFNPIDYVLTTFCVYIPPLLISNHVVTQIVWFSVLVCESTNAHCGYRIPFLPDARDHDFHHSHSNHANEKYRFVNMGSFFLIWDRILGTRDPCTNWWIEKEAAEKEAQKKTQ